MEGTGTSNVPNKRARQYSNDEKKCFYAARKEKSAKKTIESPGRKTDDVFNLSDWDEDELRSNPDTIEEADGDGKGKSGIKAADGATQTEAAKKVIASSADHAIDSKEHNTKSFQKDVGLSPRDEFADKTTHLPIEQDTKIPSQVLQRPEEDQNAHNTPRKHKNDQHFRVLGADGADAKWENGKDIRVAFMVDGREQIILHDSNPTRKAEREHMACLLEHLEGFETVRELFEPKRVERTYEAIMADKLARIMGVEEIMAATKLALRRNSPG